MILGPVGDRTGWNVEAAIALFLVIFPALLAAFGLGTDLGTRILVLGLFGLGVDLIFGYAGLLSFGQAAFYGTGGFVTANLLIHHLVPNALVALAAGTLAGAAAGALIGSLALRQVGIYFAMLTLAFGQLFYFLENSPLRAYTGSESGLPGVPKPIFAVGPWTLDFTSNLGTYAFVALIFFAGFFVARRIVRSPFGAVLRGIRENPERTLASGHDVARYKLVAFTIAAAYGGLAGGLLGIFQGYMPPEAFSIDQSGEIVVMTVIGGPGTLVGPLVGAGVWTLLRQGLQNIDVIAGIWKLILGIVFIVLITGFRRGLVGGAVALWQRLRPAQ
jgi:branched-chain amino acid transport system permease protein